MKIILPKLGEFIKNFRNKSKYESEIDFWKNEIHNLVRWYKGELKTHYMTPAPKDEQKAKTYVISHSAILTWLKLHQEPKYLEDLMLDKKVFSGQNVLDIGSGPFPSALVFEGINLYMLDPLLPEYIKIGYPLHYYDRVKFIYGFSENIPIINEFFDAIISVNSIDHVDDLYRTSKEIKRVLKIGGKIRIHAHYHLNTVTEPIELSDDIMINAFNWCKGFKKINESVQKKGSVAGDKEVYTLWSNFI